MSVVPSSDCTEVLRYLHGKLDAHFRRLHLQRKKLQGVSPVYALEHELGSADFELLLGSVRLSVAEGMGARHRLSWLPFIVYAAESAYDYLGDEYWPTFEQATPGWRGDQRHWIKDWFSRFASEYGGAIPTGAFADNFTIIAWPITHAVLPAYLQRQLAQLLFEFRTGLSSTLLGDPAELGVRLAVRARSYSERFQVFCQNTTLLGQVAAALLSGEDEESPYLVKSTLDRLLEGLSHERQAQHWLTSARQAASRIRSDGFKRQHSRSGPKEVKQRLPTATDPRLLLRYLDGAWSAYAELPDMTALSKRLPQVYDELRTLRGRVNGSRRPVPTGGLVYPGQTVRFDVWPDPAKPFVQLEQGTEPVNAILADQCVITRGSWWLYGCHGAGLAFEIKGGFLRPGHRYILICIDGHQPPAVSWAVPAPLRVAGANAYQLDVPAQVTAADASRLVEYGLSAQSLVAIHPVGLVASAWDGEGVGEWLAGEPVIVGIRSELQPTQCLVTVDGALHFIAWPGDQAEISLSLEGMDVGSHDVGVILFGASGDEIANGSLTITVRDPQVRPENAAAGEGIRMLASPARPTLAELWDGRTRVTVDGPPDSGAELTVGLYASGGAELAEIHRKVSLPIDSKQWIALGKSVRDERPFKESYDEAESCVLTVLRDGIGMASITCERGFQPLRWRFATRHDGSVIATLIDRTDRGNTRVQRFSAEAPLTAVLHRADTVVTLPPRGGLLRATSGDAEALVLAPTNPNGAMALGLVRPCVPHVEKSIDGIMKLVEAHRLWATADLPADPFAVHDQHLATEAITRAITVLLCGRYWAALERKLERVNEPADHLEEMQDTIGISPSHKALAAEIGRSLYRWLQPEALLSGFSDVIAATLADSGMDDQTSAPRFLLTLASRPAQITLWPTSERNLLLERVITSPVLLRAARFVVLATRALNGSEAAERGLE